VKLLALDGYCPSGTWVFHVLKASSEKEEASSGIDGGLTVAGTRSDFFAILESQGVRDSQAAVRKGREFTNQRRTAVLLQIDCSAQNEDRLKEWLTVN
jgi:hypothetical protein